MTPEPAAGNLGEFKPGGGFTAIERSHWIPLMRRCRGDLVLFGVVMLIYDDTCSWKPPRQWCARSISEFCKLTGASERNVMQALQRAERLGWISREQADHHTHRGRYQCHPERFAETPLPPPRPPRARQKPKPQVAAAFSRLPIAAMRVPHNDAESGATMICDRESLPTAAEASTAKVLQSGAELMTPSRHVGRISARLGCTRAFSDR